MSAKDVIIALDFPTKEATLAFLDKFPAGENLRWPRNCNRQNRRRKKSRCCLFYHGQKRKQPQPRFC